MVEPIMYFAIGFLVASLLGLVLVPLIHNRAVRLTMRRLEAATPFSMAEIQADKDQLRAEFAMSTRRLEMSVEQLKAKTTSQLGELGKKTDGDQQAQIRAQREERRPAGARGAREDAAGPVAHDRGGVLGQDQHDARSRARAHRQGERARRS